MLCEKHANANIDEAEEDDIRATRRVTRFIDLAGMPSGPGPGSGPGEESLR